jgi:TonB family protein
MYSKGNYFSYHFKRVLLVHIIIIALLFACWGVSVLFNKIRKKPPLTLPVNFVITSAQQNVKTIDDVNPIHDVEPPPVKDVQKIPAKKVYKPVIKVNKTKVVRGEKKPEVSRKKVTAEQLKKELGSNNSNVSYTLSQEQKNMVRIRNALYQAWLQPSKTAVGDAKVTLQISLDSKGNIIGRKLIGTSGNKTLDDSVIASASRVNRIPGLTKEFLKRNRKVTISFRVE